MAEEVCEFFGEGKHHLLISDIKLKLNKEDEKRIRVDLQMPIDSNALNAAPPAVKDAFYAIVKDGHSLNPIGIVTKYSGAKVRFYSTRMTKDFEIGLDECVIRDLEVTRPKNKSQIEDGDVKLRFHINAPASRKLLVYFYENFGASVFAEFEDAQPFLSGLKEETPKGDDGKQPSLDMSEKKAEEPKTDEAKADAPKEPTKSAKKKKH